MMAMKGQGRPHHVYVFPNGMVACCDQYGEQMPKYQGRKEKALPKLRADYPDINLRSGEWHHFDGPGREDK